MTTPEGKVKRKLDEWLDINMPGHWRVKPRGGPFGKAGCPDVLICWRGIFIAIEVKSEEGEVSALQMMNLKTIKIAGGISAVLRGYDKLRLNAIKNAALQKLYDERRRGWDDALDCHSKHGMAGWSTNRNEYLRKDLS